MTRALLILSSVLMGTPGAATDGGAVEIVIENVRSNQGTVLVQLCPERQFLRTCAIGGHVPAHVGSVTVTLPRVPPGDYAAMVFHDRNGNGTLDRWMGIPREDFGFSRMIRLPLRPPRFRDAAFSHGMADQKIVIRIGGYFG